MYSEAIAVANETFAANKRVCADAAEVRAYTRALLIEFRRHRFVQVSGGSDADNDDQVRALLRDFCTADAPKSYVGYSRGSACQACGGPINPGEIEYDLVTAAATLRLDGQCYAVFIDIQSTTPGAATP